VLCCDVDNPGHGDWNAELEAQAAAEYSELAVLATAGVYHTAHGRRMVQRKRPTVTIWCSTRRRGDWGG
jgi:hypothetical protein